MKVLKAAISVLFVGALALAAATARADDKDGHQGKHWDKYEMLKKQLDLTDAQVSQWKDLEKGEREQGKLSRDKAKADEANLAVLVDENASADQLKTALKSLEDDHKQMQAAADKKKEALKAILTPIQQAKLVVSWSEHHGRGALGGRGGWKGHPGGPGAAEDKGPQGGPEPDHAPDKQ